ncbi:HlyD family type I secretion periplasmic adaptor subunit [Pseudoroseomonas globiformis]|uniref:Membrane fusion protein (MFP) family protein n=1 Tax=Teichococcus globiformis TaxID=2307229 RepID=A0ABV7GBU4_9PROT
MSGIVPGGETLPVPSPLPRGSRQPRPDSHVLALEEVRVHGLERAVILGAALLVVGGIVWSATTRIPELSIGLGEIVPATAPAPVQHAEGGIVTEVLVAEGQFVEAGQPLLHMNGTALQADLAQARLRLQSLQAQAQRLRAVAEGGSAMPAAVANGFAVSQRAAFEARLQALSARRDVLLEQAAQRRNDLETWIGQIAALDAQLALHRSELATREALSQQGLTTRLALLDARRSVMNAAAERDRLRGQLAGGYRSLAEAEARVTELDASAVDEARQEAARVALETAETAEAVGRLEDRANRVVLRAPVEGVLRGVAVHRPGTVLPPGGQVAEIMPLSAALVADVRLAPRDIGFIAVGQAVQVKIQAFDYARFGTLSGVVERVSAGTFLDEQKQPHYRARIALDQQHVGHDPRQALLAAGMTVQADITTGAKTVLQYLLKPIYSATAASFHER